MSKINWIFSFLASKNKPSVLEALSIDVVVIDGTIFSSVQFKIIFIVYPHIHKTFTETTYTFIVTMLDGAKI